MNTRRQFLNAVGCAAVPLLATGVLVGPEGLFAAKGVTELRVLVLDDGGEPIPRASVLLSRVKSTKGDKVKVKGDSIQIKTSMQGTAPLPPLPRGRYLLQVINTGFQTYDDLIELTETEQTVSVTLSPPQQQFSVHKKP